MGVRRDYEKLLGEAEDIVGEDLRFDVRLKKVCRLLSTAISYYNWVGFYIADPARRELLLGPYVGTPTDHIRIAYGRGICGQAVEREQTFLVQDVTQETSYIPCNMHVRSEIVVPVFRSGKVVAEIDVDSLTLSAFSGADQRFLESLAERVAPIIRNEA